MSNEIQKYAVIGWPIAHSRSPKMQQAGFDAAGIPATYEAIPVPPGQLANTIANLIQRGFRGWNITVPYKEEIIPLVEVVGEEAKAAGSVNTVVVRDGRLQGYSTDGYGVDQALKHEFGFTTQPSNQLFLGTGGAARAVAVYAARHGAQNITLANRTPEKAVALAKFIRKAAPQCQVNVIPLAQCPEMEDALKQSDILFQCTSLGLHADDPTPIPVDIIPPALPVFDFVYTPSNFAKQLQKQGNPLTTGLEMLLWQGAKSFYLWTGVEPDIDAMRQGLVTQ